MVHRRRIEGFLHYRTDLGDGIRTGVVFSSCPGVCLPCCCSYVFPAEFSFAEERKETHFFTASELGDYLKEEKTLYYTRPLGVTFLGAEPLWEPFFCQDVARCLREAKISLSIYTCGMCHSMAFDLMEGLVDLYVLRLFTIDPHSSYYKKETLDALQILEQKGAPYRLLIPVLDGVNTGLSEEVASFAAALSSLKSVILDFSSTALSEAKRAAFRRSFLSRGIPLY